MVAVGTHRGTLSADDVVLAAQARHHLPFVSDKRKQDLGACHAFLQNKYNNRRYFLRICNCKWYKWRHTIILRMKKDKLICHQITVGLYTVYHGMVHANTQRPWLLRCNPDLPTALRAPSPGCVERPQVWIRLPTRIRRICCG